MLTSVLLFAATIIAGPPKAPEKVVCKVGDLTRFEVMIEAGKSAGFRAAFDDVDCFFDRLYSDDSSRMRFFVQAKKPGRYAVVFWTKDETTSAVVWIETEEKPTPPPDPKPKPPDDDTTPVVAQKLFVTIWRETAAQTPSEALVVNSKSVRDKCKAAGHSLRVYDPQSEPTKTTKFQPWIDKAGGLPCVILQDKDGRVVHAEKLPPTEQRLVDVIAKWGGA